MSTPTTNDIHADSHTKIYQSMTNYLNEVVTTKLTVNEEDGKVKTVAKIAAHEVASTALFAVGLVESVVRNVLALIVKLFTVIIPKGYAYKIDQNVVKPLFAQAGMTTAATVEAASKLVSNFMSQEFRDKIHASIDRGIANIYLSHAMDKVERFHINGFSTSAEIQGYIDAATAIVRPTVADLNSEAANKLREGAAEKAKGATDPAADDDESSSEVSVESSKAKPKEAPKENQSPSFLESVARGFFS